MNRTTRRRFLQSDAAGAASLSLPIRLARAARKEAICAWVRGMARRPTASIRGSRQPFGVFGLFSAFANLPMLTDPVFMLRSQDRVLSSSSGSALPALIGIGVLLS